MTKKLEDIEYFYPLCLIKYLYERTSIRKIDLNEMTVLELVKI